MLIEYMMIGSAVAAGRDGGREPAASPADERSRNLVDGAGVVAADRGLARRMA